MATTIQINESTKQMLERIKILENRSSFDEVVTELAEKKLSIPKSFFGKGKISKFKRQDRLKFHDL